MSKVLFVDGSPNNFNTSSAGINSIKIISGSTNNKYWQSLNVLFYTSGSSIYGSENKFESLSKNLSIQQRVGKHHLNKFHGTGISTHTQSGCSFTVDDEFRIKIKKLYEK